MNKNQIDILLKHGDIWPYESKEFKDGMSDCFFLNTGTDNAYFISNNLFELFYSIANKILNEDIDNAKELFLLELKQREKLFWPGTSSHKDMLDDLISEQKKLLTAAFDIQGGSYLINGIGSSDNNQLIQLIIEFDLLSIDNNGADLIKLLKFDLLKGSIIDSNSFKDLCDNFKIQYLEKFFSQPIDNLTKKITAEENIKHIQSLIKSESTFEKSSIGVNTKGSPNDPGLTHQAIALLCILKGTDLYTLEQCREALSVYNPKKSQNQAKALQKIFKELHEQGITIGCSVKIKGNARIMALRSIFYYLETNKQRQKLKLTINQIKRKMACDSKN